jgi:hypothetical protein
MLITFVLVLTRVVTVINEGSNQLLVAKSKIWQPTVG